METDYRIEGEWFVDAENRRRLLRGVNLGGSSKVPTRPDGATHLPIDLINHRQVSFVGRPFPLDEADEHFRRLKRWGFDCLRLLTTWEAVEHCGPGIYDEVYLDYLCEVVQRAGQHGFAVFIDPHQDVWSRFTGGDGAPGWTLELAGFDLSRLDASEAAITMPARLDNYNSMLWHLNGGRLASATMFTLFFAGRRFAPELEIEGENIQDFLQRHFIQTMVKVAERMAGIGHVLGYDSLNEPQPGYIGLEDLSATQVMWADGPLVTPFESMFIPSGIPHTLPWIEFDGFQPSQTREVQLNPAGVSAWQSPEQDIWRAHGVWEMGPDGAAHILQPDAFAGVSFFQDCLRPFIRRYSAAIQKVHPQAAIFVEGQPGSLEPLNVESDLPVVNASHWYDIVTVHTKHYNPARTLEFGTFQVIEGEREVQELFQGQIGLIKRMSHDWLGGAPTLIGEFGVPYDLDGGEAFRSGDFSEQVDALTAYYNALDANLVHATQWVYTADNSNRWGDGWNREDLSIYSPDQRDEPANPDSGARALQGFCRPRLVAAAGLPLMMSFQRASGIFELEIQADGRATAPTLVYLPTVQFPGGMAIETNVGEVQYNALEQQAAWTHPREGIHRLRVTRS